MSDLTPEQSAQLAVDGVVRADDAVHVEASTDPADLHVSDWQRVQWLHRQGDERGLMAEVQRIHHEAVERERAKWVADIEVFGRGVEREVEQERAARLALVAKIEALADEWPADCDHEGTCERDDAAAAIRALLDGGAA